LSPFLHGSVSETPPSAFLFFLIHFHVLPSVYIIVGLEQSFLNIPPLKKSLSFPGLLQSIYLHDKS
jgi:hypothetical protein